MGHYAAVVHDMRGMAVITLMAAIGAVVFVQFLTADR
jgi:hypothetical protein